MLKKIVSSLIVLVLLLSPLLSLPENVRAESPCTSSQVQIGYTPSLFQANPPAIKLLFQIGNSNTEGILAGKEVRLRFGRPRSLVTLAERAALTFNPILNFFFNDQEFTQPTKIDGTAFELELTHSDFKKPGNYSGALEWNSDGKGKWETFCTQVNFQVGGGLTKACKLDPGLPAIIPPNSKLKIKFVGKANTKYIVNQLNVKGASPGEFLSVMGQLLGQDIIKTTTTTDSNGQGKFDNYSINGSSGDEVRAFVISEEDYNRTVNPGEGRKLTLPTDGVPYYLNNSCQAAFKLSTTAAPPPPLNDDPIDPGNGNGSVIKNSGQVSRAAGIPCQGIRGVITAIGCISVSPTALINELLQFLVAISGGIALLMMAGSAVQMMVQGADAKALASARQRFIGATVGLLFIIFSVFILRVLGVDLLQIPGFS